MKDRIALWIHHLLLNRLVPPDVTRQSLWLGDDGEIRLRPVARPRGRASSAGGRLLGGVSPSALRCFRSRATPTRGRISGMETAEAALAVAHKAWDENEYTGQGEACDAYHRLVFRCRDPLDEEFSSLAETVFLPLLLHQEEQ